MIHAGSVGDIAGPPAARSRMPATACSPSRCRTARRPSRSRSRPGCGPGWPPRRVGRTDSSSAIGGGAVTDLAGFVAATWLRGVRVVLVPTTLLGMVDAAIGGKTAINIPEGKNLVGAFHAPAGVLADLATLETLPRADYVSGLAEVIKAGFIADPVILDLVEDDPAGAAVPHGRHTRELIERAIRMKAQVVAADFREAGLREIAELRAHSRPRDRARRGVQVPARRRGRDRDGLRRRAGPAGRPARRQDRGPAPRVLASVGLPPPTGPTCWPDLRAAMAVDKKARGARCGLSCSRAWPGPAVLADPPEELLEQAYRRCAP